jgi:1,4-dihydroxy-2-naphthoate polyprenyltransferase
MLDRTRMRRLRAFVRLSRPLFLYGGFAGVALGAAVAAWTGRRLDAPAYLWAQGLVTAFHLMVHYANDFFDQECDASATRTAWSGGSGILTSGELPPRAALIAALVCAALGLLASARFALTGNLVVAGLGVAILAFAWCYSAPPVRFAARGLGELDTALVVAVLVPSVGYAASTGRVDAPILTAVLSPAAAMLAMMLCVELPDAEADSLAGKRNLVVRGGPARARQFITAAAAFATFVALLLALRTHAGLTTLALAPAAVCGIQLIRFANNDARPASMAFWGVALYATTVSGLAVVYAGVPR